MVKIKDIDGFYTHKDKFLLSLERGFQPFSEKTKISRDILIEKGSVEIGLNRERLARVLSEKMYPVSFFNPKADINSSTTSGSCLRIADAIILAEATLLERKGK